jgi:hypothetical protein
VSTHDANRRCGHRGGRPGPQPDAVERGRQVLAERQDLSGPLAEALALQRRVRRMLVELLVTPDARRNQWTPALSGIVRELAESP